MLIELKIKNLALIEQLHVFFGRKLTVFTGETGAGKSIILQALALLSGARASAALIRTGMDNAQVEALFALPDNPSLRADICDMGVDDGGEILIKRVLSKTGKSRYYLNGSLATARLVSKISEYLVSVASQHDHQQLLIPKRHLDFVDLVGDLWPLRLEVADYYATWSQLRKEYEQLSKKEQDKEQRRDFLSFQVKEISQAGLIEDEDVQLAIDRQRLKSADNLRALGQKSYSALSSAANFLSKARKGMESMADLDNQMDELSVSVVEQSYLIEDYTSSIRNYLDELPRDDGHLETINARIDLIQQLKRKYGNSLLEVINHGKNAAQELADLEALDDRLQNLITACKSAEDKVRNQAEKLSAKRKIIANELEKSLKKELRSLSFDNAVISIVFAQNSENKRAEITRTGIDKLEFMFSANQGEPLQSLAKVASGGELSRLMLALKCLLARKDLVETVIFDEVDSGISGKAAEAVATKIKELAQHHQVMCITHLPQIASCANEHFVVEKIVKGGRTRTQIDKLDQTARIAEIARMLDGESVSKRTMDFAAELVARNDA